MKWLLKQIPLDEMQKRWPLITENKAKEFGWAMSVIGDDPLDPVVEKMTKKAVAYNFARTTEEYPQLREWSLVRGATRPVWRYEDCPNSSDPGESCIEDCPYCEGYGRVPVEIIPGKLEYSFGWYSIASDEGPTENRP